MYRTLRLNFIYAITICSICWPSAHIWGQSERSEVEIFEYWTDHLPYNTFNHVAQIGEQVFAASDNNLLVVNSTSDELSRYSRINGLTGSNITALRADEASGTLWIGYADGRIDIWSPMGIRPINAIKETPSYTGLKRINAFAFYQGKAYAATDFGIVEFDITTRLAGRTLLLGANFSTIAVKSFDVSNAGIVCAYSPTNTSSFYFADVNVTLPQWTTSSFQLSTDNYGPQHITYYGVEDCFVFSCDDLSSGTYLLAMTEDQNGQWNVGPYRTPYGTSAQSQDIQNITVTGRWLVLTRDFNVIGRSANGPGNYADSINISGVLFPPGTFRPLCAVHSQNDSAIYMGNFTTGLFRIRPGLVPRRFLPSAPHSNRAYKLLSYGQGRNFTYSNATTPGGPENFGGVILAHGALTDLWTKTYIGDGMGVYTAQSWTGKQDDALYGTSDVIDAAYTIDATGNAQLYLSSWGKGLVKLSGTGGPDQLDTVAFYNTTNTGGVLKGVGGDADDLRTGGIAFDQDGTLWGVQSLVNTPLYSINTEGVFTAYSLSPGANAVALKDVVTSDGMVFIQSRTNGIYGYTETNGMAVKRQIRSGVGNGDLPSDKVLSMAVDQDGELWIGTDEGLAVIYSPENVFDGTGSRDARPILFEEDGVVQKLLGDNPVSAIHVDGGNQKWLGTRGAGLFLVSPDGLRTLHQFTAENSPLLSNTINSIASDPTTGEVLIATDAGVIGYRSNATPGHTSASPELHIYPNPVRPGYEGPVFIQGNSQDARIKITDVSGALVHEMEAAGGQAQWDGTKLDGHPVASGVYLIYTTDDLGTVTAQGKVLIVR